MGVSELAPRQRQPAAEWTEWVAYNLAAGVDTDEVEAELRQQGFEPGSASSLVERVLADPVFRAAQKHAGEVQKWTALMDVLMDLESQSFDFRRLERRENVSAEEFHEKYYALNRPVILTDVLPRWPAREVL